MEKAYAPVEDLNRMANADAEGVAPKSLGAFIEARKKARDAVKLIRQGLLLEDGPSV